MPPKSEEKMTCLEYLNRLTDNGSKVIVCDKSQLEYQKVTRIVNETTWTEVHTYMSESTDDRKKQEKMLERITHVVNVIKTPYQFYRHMMVIVPKDFRNGEYAGHEDEWLELFENLSIELCATMSAMMHRGRNSPGANIELANLKLRCEAFAGKSTATVNDAEGRKVKTITFEEF